MWYDIVFKEKREASRMHWIIGFQISDVSVAMYPLNIVTYAILF